MRNMDYYSSNFDLKYLPLIAQNAYKASTMKSLLV